MPMSGEEITKRIQTAIPDAQITLEDLAGDNDHWKVIVMSAAFAGKLRVAQHQMVYAAFDYSLSEFPVRLCSIHNARTSLARE